VDSLKVLDLKWPIREADLTASKSDFRFTPGSGHWRQALKILFPIYFRITEISLTGSIFWIIRI
jgi:hypothetical protein